MISTELFTEVYSEPYMLKAFPDKPSWIKWYANQFDVEHNIGVDINIYELAHRCKEWAKQWFTLESAVSFDKDNKPYCRLIGDIEEEIFEASTEPEAIFKACQWIFDNRSKL